MPVLGVADPAAAIDADLGGVIGELARRRDQRHALDLLLELVDGAEHLE